MLRAAGAAGLRGPAGTLPASRAQWDLLEPQGTRMCLHHADGESGACRRRSPVPGSPGVTPGPRGGTPPRCETLSPYQELPLSSRPAGLPATRVLITSQAHPFGPPRGSRSAMEREVPSETLLN